MAFEAFGLSLPPNVVVNHIGKITKTFPPNPRLSFPVNDDVYAALANTLSFLSSNILDDAIPKTKKAGTMHRETRDVASPRYVVEALGGIIRAAGYNLPPVDT